MPYTNSIFQQLNDQENSSFTWNVTLIDLISAFTILNELMGEVFAVMELEDIHHLAMGHS